MSNHDNASRNEAFTDAVNHFRQACEIFERETIRLRQEQESIDSMTKKLDQVHFSSTVKLNVGGQHFTTSLQTLRKDPNSMLAAMFSGKFDTKPSEDGSFFIDRDGTHFRFILNYLRDGEMILPKDETALRQLQKEAEFYQIQGIIDALKPPAETCKPSKPFEESEILTNEAHQNILKAWLPTELEGEWRLLFRASRDGFAARAFHSKCDDKGATITIVKSVGNIFGGFTEKSWTSVGSFTSCNQAFLFSMVNPCGLGPTKMSLIGGNRQYAILCNGSYGPIFGGGNDLQISGNANQIRKNQKSYSNLGHTYQCPPGQNNTFFTGLQGFTVTDYEVFGFRN